MPKTPKPATPETAPYLKQVRVRDYRSIRDAKVDFKPGLNIIIGKNGAGKTNFLNLTNRIASLFDEPFDGIGCEIILGGKYNIKATIREEANSINRIDDIEKGSIDTANGLLIEATNGHRSVKAETLDEAIEELTDDATYYYYNLLIKHGIPSTRTPIIDESTDLVLGIRNIVLDIDGSKKRVFEIESGFVRRLCGTIFNSVRKGFKVDRISSTAFVTIEEVKKLASISVEAYLKRFDSYLPLYSPITAIRYNNLFQVYRNTIQDEIIIKGLTLEYQIGEDWLPFNALSDGTKRILYILTEISTPSSVLIDRKNENIIIKDLNKIIFLEEPELGIHPDQLQKLLSLIREVSKEHQVIMTTHSPQTLDMLSKNELDRITICELDPKKGTQFRKLSAAKKAKAKAYMQNDSYLSDFWRFSNLEDPD